MAGELAAGPLIPLTARTALTSWQFAPVVGGALVVLAGGYLAGVVRVQRQHPARPWPGIRLAAFAAGLAVIAVATQSSIGIYDDALFSVHMVQHVLLIMVAPPLLVAGRPVTLVLHAWGNPVHALVQRAVRSPVAAALTWPPAATLLYCVVVAGTHTPLVMDLVLRSGTAHDGEHALYLAAGYLFFLPVAGSEPIRWRMSLPGRYLVILLAMMTDSFTGIVFTFQSREVFAPYAHTGRTWDPHPVADLHLGGIVMLIGSDIAMTIVAVTITVAFFRAPSQGLELRPAGRRGALAWQTLGAGTTAQPDGSPGAAADLAAYNAYLRSLDERTGTGRPATAPPGLAQPERGQKSEAP